jgi:glycosyltransferase involved in cell wall biosynthesis
MAGSALVSSDYDGSNPWNKDLAYVQNFIHTEKNIISTGFVPTEELVELYNIATMVVMPSLYEGFGLPILEAMSCGCPVVTSKNGAIPEVAGEAAYYVKAEDENSIESGIIDLFKDQNLRKELSEKGLRQAREFSWEKTARETVEVYEKFN